MSNFFIGFLIGVAFSIVFFWVIDSRYEYYEQTLNKIEMICEGLGSTPLSFDTDTVTCANGLEVKFTTGAEGDS